MTTIANYIRARLDILRSFGTFNLWTVNELYKQLIEIPLPTNLVDVSIELLYEEEYDMEETIMRYFNPPSHRYIRNYLNL
jgi:hypothetical protein